jgi:5-amino-6-(5-phosphoribosylamino)uracil reductase
MAMAALGDTLGIETILLEGGAATNGTFLKAGLIDEISVLIHPAVDGLAGVESIFEYRGEPGERPGAGQALRYFNTETLNGRMVWLCDQVEKV